MLWHVPDLNRSWMTIASDVREFGDRVSPRGQNTVEVLGATIVVEDPTNVLPVGTTRNPHIPIAAAEALQLIGGVSYPNLMARIGKKFPLFQDGGTFHGAYGPRVRAQLPSVVRRLSEDRDSRQALMTIWDPALDAHVDGLKDYPCTTVLHFMIRNNQLVLHTTMRSNDVYWGLTYDAFQFTQLQCTVARALGIDVGAYYHHANSLHVYERDFEAIDKITVSDAKRQPTWLDGLSALGNSPVERMEHAACVARGILRDGVITDDHTTLAECWYFDILREYLDD